MTYTIGDVIKQTDSEVKKYNFFLAFSIRVCLGFNLMETPQRLGKDKNS